MAPTWRIEDLIPHRQKMQLIDTIVAMDRTYAETEAVVKSYWPLIGDEGVSPIVLIELAAQTAGVCFGWNEMLKQTSIKGGGPKGWLVGIKRADFYIDRIDVGTCITTRSENTLAAENYKEIAATARIEKTLIADISLQVLQADRTAFSGLSG